MITKQHKALIGKFFRNDDPDPQGRYAGKSDEQVYEIALAGHDVKVTDESDDKLEVELYHKASQYRSNITVPK